MIIFLLNEPIRKSTGLLVLGYIFLYWCLFRLLSINVQFAVLVFLFPNFLVSDLYCTQGSSISKFPGLLYAVLTSALEMW